LDEKFRNGDGERLGQSIEDIDGWVLLSTFKASNV
jgi:hypothetical protein